jgi:predicted HicB family RNase H-like nuclease
MGGQISSQVICEQETHDHTATEIANLASIGALTRFVPRESSKTPKISSLTTTVKSRPSSTNEWWRKSQNSTPPLRNLRVNGMLKERLASGHNTLAERILELRRADNIASEATDAKTMSDQLVKALLVTVRTLEIDNSRLIDTVHSTARLQAKTEQELKDLVIKCSEEHEEAVDAKAASDQLVVRLSVTVRTLETDKSCLTKKVNSAAQLQAKTEQELKDLSTKCSEEHEEAVDAKAASDQLVVRLSATVRTLETDKSCLTKKVNSAAQLQAKTEQELKDSQHFSSLTIKRLEERECNLARQLTHAHESHAKTNDDLCAATDACAELRAAKAGADNDNTALRERLQQLQLENHDDSDLYEWDWAESGGFAELVSRSLHGSDIMPLISLESHPEFMVTCIAELMFESGSDRLASWLLRWNQDEGISSQLIHVVHLLNDFQAFYGSKRDKAHISPDGSQHQTSRIKLLLLELLRSNGKPKHLNSLFAAILSCFSGRKCLKKLQHFGIFLDRHERELLTQACRDRARISRSR